MRTGGSSGAVAVPADFARRAGRWSGKLEAIAHDGFSGKFSLKGYTVGIERMSVPMISYLCEDRPRIVAALTPKPVTSTVSSSGSLVEPIFLV